MGLGTGEKNNMVSRCQEKRLDSCPDGTSNPTALPAVNLDHFLSAEEQDKPWQLGSSPPGSSES